MKIKMPNNILKRLLRIMYSQILGLSIVLALTLTVIPIANGETWRVQIPAGSSEPVSTVHFVPSEVSVRPGDKVEWGNADSVTHTVTSGTLEMGISEMFDSGHIGPGGHQILMM